MDCCTRPCGERRRNDALSVFLATEVFAKLLLAVVRVLFFLHQPQTSCDLFSVIHSHTQLPLVCCGLSNLVWSSVCCCANSVKACMYILRSSGSSGNTIGLGGGWQNNWHSFWKKSHAHFARSLVACFRAREVTAPLLYSFTASSLRAPRAVTPK